ncbi:MAG TPA: hypothetical protein VKF60_13475 [Myxococcota bacterium]|nr:hypothetical protein [Myxococcota bacterium]
MPTLPSIKGSVFAVLVEDIQKLVSGQRLKREELARWLNPKDLGYLDAPVQPFEWYDIRSYGRMSLLLRDVEGGGSNEYLRKRGARNAKRLLEAGLYQQLEYTHRTLFAQESEKNARFEAFGRDLGRLTTISSSILNFGRTGHKPDPDRKMRWIIEVTQAKEYPEPLVWASDGFTNEMARQHNTPDLWAWERPEPERIVWHMTREL